MLKSNFCIAENHYFFFLMENHDKSFFNYPSLCHEKCCKQTTLWMGLKKFTLLQTLK
jgi:hypothetical protein